MTRFQSLHVVAASIVTVMVVTAVPAVADNHLNPRQWSNGEIDQVKADVEDAKREAGTAATNAVELATDARTRFQMVTPDMRGMIDDAIAEVQRTIQEVNEGRAAFLGNDCAPGSPCHTFRADLLSLIDDIETLHGAMAETTSVDTRLDFSRMRAILANLPGRPLYPIYRSLVEELGVFESGFPQALRDLAADLPALRAGIDVAGASSVSGPSGVTTNSLADRATCDSILADDDFERKARSVLGAAGIVKLIGKGLVAIGETTATGTAGADGYVQVTLKNNWRKSIGSFLDGGGDFGLSFAGWAHAKLRYCRLLDGQHELASLLEANERRELETLVSTCTPLTSAILPDDDGDEPAVYGIVDDAIAAWESAGQDAKNAAKFRAEAGQLFDRADYLKAFQKLCKAYDRMAE